MIYEESASRTLTQGVVERVISVGHFDVQLAGVLRVCHIGSALLRTGVAVREGDRVTVIAEQDGKFVGEITSVRPRPELPPSDPEPRPSIISTRSGRRHAEPLHLDRTARPDWPTAEECDAKAGDEAYCTAGPARVVRVLGKTSSGSRLLELSVPAQPRVPFFAAASNVLIAPR